MISDDELIIKTKVKNKKVLMIYIVWYKITLYLNQQKEDKDV